MEAGPGLIETVSVRAVATEDHAEVCPVSRGVMFQPLSGPLQPGVRFLCDPIPAPPTVFLAVHLPWGQRYGLTTFPVCHTTGLGSASSPVVLWRRIPKAHGDNRPRTFWFKPDSSFGLSILTVFIRGSHVLPIPASLAPQPGTAPSICSLPRGRTAPWIGGYVVGRASHTTVASDARRRRLPLVAQRVRSRTLVSVVGQ